MNRIHLLSSNEVPTADGKIISVIESWLIETIRRFDQDDTGKHRRYDSYPYIKEMIQLALGIMGYTISKIDIRVIYHPTAEIEFHNEEEQFLWQMSDGNRQLQETIAGIIKG